MSAIGTAAREVWGLFVEDASFSIAIGACLAVAMLVLPSTTVPLSWRGPLLVVGLAAVLVENVWRSARAARTRP